VSLKPEIGNLKCEIGNLKIQSSRDIMASRLGKTEGLVFVFGEANGPATDVTRAMWPAE
jgi:hypothetical protein